MENSDVKKPSVKKIPKGSYRAIGALFKIPKGSYRAIGALFIAVLTVVVAYAWETVPVELGVLSAGVMTFYFGTRAVEDRKRRPKTFPLWLPIGTVRFTLWMIYLIGFAIFVVNFGYVARDLATLASYATAWYFGNRFLGDFKFGGN